VFLNYQGICQNNVVNKITLILVNIEKYFQNVSCHILESIEYDMIESRSRTF